MADLLRCERDLAAQLDQVRERLDAELIDVRAPRTPFKELAYAVQARLALPTTADELERLSRVLRQRTTVAHRRGAARGAGTCDVARRDAQPHHDRMTHDQLPPEPYLRRRIIEEYGPPPTGDLGDPDLDGTEDDVDDDEAEDEARDHHLGDAPERR